MTIRHDPENMAGPIRSMARPLRPAFFFCFLDPWQGLYGLPSSFVSTAPTSESLVLVDKYRRILSHQNLTLKGHRK